MKLTKQLLAAVLTLGLFSGSAQALSLTTIDSILTVGDGPINPLGLETEAYENSVFVNLFTSPYAVGTDDGDLDGDHNLNGTTDGNTTSDWIVVNVVQSGLFSLVTSSWDEQNGNDGALNIGIYNATNDGGGQYSTVGGAFDSTSGAPLTLSLAAGTYLFQLFGDLDTTALTNQLANYTMEITTVIPVPAAVWLFGTAAVGFLGLRRRKISAAA